MRIRPRTRSRRRTRRSSPRPAAVQPWSGHSISSAHPSPSPSRMMVHPQTRSQHTGRGRPAGILRGREYGRASGTLVVSRRAPGGTDPAADPISRRGSLLHAAPRASGPVTGCGAPERERTTVTDVAPCAPSLVERAARRRAGDHPDPEGPMTVTTNTRSDDARRNRPRRRTKRHRSEHRARRTPGARRRAGRRQGAGQRRLRRARRAAEPRRRPREAGHRPAFPIQTATLPDSLSGRDVLGRGRTGSGKTIAFAIPLVARLATERRRAGRVGRAHSSCCRPVSSRRRCTRRSSRSPRPRASRP